MSQKKLLLAAFFAFLAIHFHESFGFNDVKRIHFDCPSCDVQRIPYNCTKASSCGGSLITNPFRLKGDPLNCGDPNYELSCESNQTILSLNSKRFLDSERYLVKAIDYNNRTIRIVDVGVRHGDCSSGPINSFLDLSAESYGRHSECSYALYWFSIYGKQAVKVK